MLELLVAALALAAASAAVMALRQGDPRPSRPPTGRPEQGDIHPGDVISHLEQDYCVEGVVTLYDGEEPFAVVASLGAEGPFLVVEPGPTPRCALAQSQPPTLLDGTVPGLVILDPGEFRLHRRAAVQAVSRGPHPCLEATSCQAGVYLGPAEGLALALVAGTEHRLLQGQVVSSGSITWLTRSAPTDPPGQAPSAPPKRE